MNPGSPFDPDSAVLGQTVSDVDPKSLQAGRSNLVALRLAFQKTLLQQSQPRLTPILVNRHGIIYDGNHAVRAAAEVNKSVEIQIVDEPLQSFGDIMKIPVTRS